MQLRKSNEMFDAGRSLNSSLSPGSAENRGWWKGIHAELISFMNKPHLVQRLTKQIVHFAGRRLKGSPSSEEDSNCASPERSLEHPNRMAKPRVEKITKSSSYQSDNDSHEENNTVQDASPCRIKRKRRKTPLRAIQHIIGKSFKSPCTVVQPKTHRGSDRFEAYGHPLRECYVLLEQFPKINRKSSHIEAADDAESQQAKDESNSNPEKTDRTDPGKDNEAAAKSKNNVAPHPKQAQNPKQPARLSSERQKPERRTIMKREPESSDDETSEAFNEVFTKRRNCDPLESDTEEFWAERRRFRKAIDYEREARELLGLNADFSTPIAESKSPVESPAFAPTAGSQRRQRRSSSISNPKTAQTRRSSASFKGSRGDAAARSAQKTPKWQQTKQVAVKVSRSGRLIKPPVDDSFV